MTVLISNLEDLKNKVWDNEKPAMLTFGFDWSGKCVIYNWMVDAIEQEFKQACEFFKVEADQARQLADHYQVNVFPTSLLLYKGEVKSVSNGIISKAHLRNNLQDFLSDIEREQLWNRL